MNSEELVNSELDKTAEDEKKSNNLEEEQECSQAALESKSSDDIDNDMDTTEVETKFKAGEESEQKDDSSASAEDDKKSETGKESSEVDNTFNEKASKGINNDNTEDVMDIAEQVVEIKAVQDLEQEKEKVSAEDEVKSKYFKEVEERSEAPENKNDSENVTETAEPKVKEDSQDQVTPESSQETVIDSSPEENTEAGPDYSNKDFETEDSCGSDTDKNSESEDSSSEMGAYISKPKSHSKKWNSKSHGDQEISDSDEDNCDLPEEDHEKPGNGKEQEKKRPWFFSFFQKSKQEGNFRKEQEIQRRMKSWDYKEDIEKEMQRIIEKGKKDNPRSKDNLKFYTGKIQCSPRGDYIDNIHREWWGDYNLLERHPSYIQWLFPIREEGDNWLAQPLQKHEAEAIKADPKAHARVLTSYKMMLDFYGMRLVNDRTGELERTYDYEERFVNLNWSSHNYLRITRILKSLGEFGYEHLKKGFIQFVLEEALVHKTLNRTLNSCEDYWIGTIRDKEDRDELRQYIRDNIP